MNAVIDASAWLRYVLQDGPACETVDLALQSCRGGLIGLHAPHHFAAEVAHVLHRLRLTGRLTSSQAACQLDCMLLMPICYHPVPDLAPAASELAWTHRLSVYDALYLAVAIGCGARLLTADDALARAASREGCA